MEALLTVPMKVLMIGENKRLFSQITCWLTTLTTEISVISVADGLGAIPMVRSAAPDMVIVNSVLPDTEICDFVKKIREFSEVPMMALCRIAEGAEPSDVLEAGADEYVTEMFDGREFVAKVRALFRRTKGIGLDSGSYLYRVMNWQ